MAGQFECPLCGKENTTRSSHVKHSRQCLSRVVALPRQKSCQRCSKAKARCDRVQPSCSRCNAREYMCEYASVNPVNCRERSSPSARSSRDTGPRDSIVSSQSQFDHSPFTEISNCDPGLQNDPDLGQTSQSPRHTNSVGEALPTDTSSSEPTQLDGISEISPAQVSPTRQAELEKRISFLSRIFRTYPRMMARKEQLPPFIHESQIAPGSVILSLSNCFALSRMWDGGGSESLGKDLIEKNIHQEMERLFSEYWNYDAATLVATFQATIIYSLILLFPTPGHPPTKNFNLSTVNKKLQELGFYISRQTLILPTDSSRTRPSWQDWILVNCKRRTMMALYCFEWITATLIDSSAFPCAEIDFLPAPTGKVLWGCATQEKWESAYDRWLGRWAGMGQYTIGELTHIPPGSDLDVRSEMWLEEADEFGVMFMGLVTMAPGGVDGFEF